VGDRVVFSCEKLERLVIDGRGLDGWRLIRGGVDRAEEVIVGGAAFLFLIRALGGDAGADTIVFLDASPLRSLWRVSRRRLNRHASVGVPAGTDPAAFHQAFLKFLRNQWRYRRKVRRELLAELARERDGRRVVVLRRESDAAAFLTSLDSPSPAGGTF
jgi:hypothetical protein